MVKQKGISKQWQEKICPKCKVPLTKDTHMPSQVKHRNYTCKDCVKRWAQKNIKQCKEYRKKYYQKNKDRRRKYYLKNKEKIGKIQKAYNQKNREKRREKSRVEYQKNKKKIKVARIKGRKRALEILGGKCVYCGCDIYEALEINHINGREKGEVPGSNLVKLILNGEVDISKLEVTCSICNIWHYVTKLKGITNKWTITWN